jgi:hypothetical protein
MIAQHTGGGRFAPLPPGLVPRGLTLDQAATFVGLSTSGFKKRQKMGDYPMPTLPGKRYDLRLLETAMDKLSDIQTTKASELSPLEAWKASRRG